MDPLSAFYIKDHVICETDSFTSFQCGCVDALVSFPWLIVLAGNPIAILNKYGDSGHPSLEF